MPAGQQPQGQQGPGIGGRIMQFMIVYFLFNTFFKGNKAPVDSSGKPIPPYMNLFPDAQEFEFRVFMSPLKEFNPATDEGKIIFEEKQLYYDWNPSNEREVTLQIPTPKVQRVWTLLIDVDTVRKWILLCTHLYQ
jgi:hypothetical protein